MKDASPVWNHASYIYVTKPRTCFVGGFIDLD